MTYKLRILVLKHLSQGPRSGYQLIKEIKEATGWKPSYGSIYPLLDQLKREKLVTARKHGKSKLYTLTAKGRTALHFFTEHHDALIQQVREWQNVMAHLCDAKQDPFFKNINATLGRDEIPFGGILNSSLHLRAELTNLSQEDLLKQHKNEVIAVIDNATQKLKGIRTKAYKGKR